ncbi:response regulator transcription factor [Streptomyces sp. NBC_01264]|uniref:response regulator transcription factor n=1 Tax=Streptomyces sp. NBC_01264 TaxID=2903804 RepID=UPI00224F7A0D|nr:response regulator transcription factor [Streptomyces sp. NBC_01264]MCX4784332.1 response regulator transcription factor [Streptomyces sp. NBC_01264]
MRRFPPFWSHPIHPSPRVPARIRVLIADDHPVYRSGLRSVLAGGYSFEVVGEYQDGQAALSAIREVKPDVAVLDYRMPLLNGSQVARALSEKNSPTKILILSAFTEAAIVYKALQDGASGYLTKTAEADEIARAVMACSRGETVLPSQLTAALVSEIRIRAEARRPHLSDRETQILEMLAAGMSTPEMARTMFLAPSTVKSNVQHVLGKLGVSGRSAAVAEAMRRGILT